jgi:hypothetical protein
MPIVVSEQVHANDQETEIIPPTQTVKTQNRVFAVANAGEHDIEVRAYGQNPGEPWQERDMKVIPPHNAESLIIGPTVLIVTLKGKTLGPGTETIVDAALVW